MKVQSKGRLDIYVPLAFARYTWYDASNLQKLNTAKSKPWGVAEEPPHASTVFEKKIGLYDVCTVPGNMPRTGRNDSHRLTSATWGSMNAGACLAVC